MSDLANKENIIDKAGDIVPSGKRSTRIIIAGGGTGGHIFPALAIAAALKKQRPGIEILFVGAKGKMEMQKIPEAGYKIIGLTISGFNRSSLIRNITLPVKLVQSFFQVTRVRDQRILKPFIDRHCRQRSHRSTVFLSEQSHGARNNAEEEERELFEDQVAGI